MLNKSQITKIITNLKVGESESVSELGAVHRTDPNEYAVTDNGEQVDGLNMKQAIQIAFENNQQ